jgi:hypothetical protein
MLVRLLRCSVLILIRSSIDARGKLGTGEERSAHEKTDIVKARLIRNYGYDEDSAKDVLNYVKPGRIFPLYNLSFCIRVSSAKTTSRSFARRPSARGCTTSARGISRTRSPPLVN